MSRKCLGLIVAALIWDTGALVSFSSAGIITTVIGGHNGDGYPAEVARSIPSHVTVDGSGNLLFADGWDHRIRRLNAVTNLMTTVAGVGEYGFSGDGLPAIEARLASPAGVAVDASGNIFVADQLNHRVRRTDAATGVITTVAGTGVASFNGDGPGTTAQLNFPSGLSVSAAGLLIADSGNHRVRLFDTQGNLRTIAGSGSMGWAGDGLDAMDATVRLANPAQAISDSQGNIYIADRSNCRVRRIDAITNIITTFAGIADPAVTPACGKTGDGGLATAAKFTSPSALAIDGQFLYILDSGVYLLRRVNLSTGIVTRVAGTGFPGSTGDGGPALQAQFDGPSGLALRNGELFVSDNDLRTIRKIDTSAIITTVVGGSNGDNYPAEVGRMSAMEIAGDGDGNLYFADALGRRIRQVDADPFTITVAGNGVFGFSGDGGAAIEAKLAYPFGLDRDANGQLCFSDQLNHRVRCISTSGIITTVAGSGQAGFNGDGAAVAVSLNFPAGLRFDVDGSILLADSSNQRIRRIRDGQITTIVGTGMFFFNGDGLGPLATNINNPTSVVGDSAGNLYIAEKSGSRIRMYDAATNTMLTIAGTGVNGSTGDNGPAILAKLNGPENLALAGDMLFVTESFSPRVRMINLQTGIISRVAGTGVMGVSGDGGEATSARLMSACGLFVDPTQSYLYISDCDAKNVRRVALGSSAPTATITTTSTPTGTPSAPFTATRTVTSTATATPVFTTTATSTATSTFVFTPTSTSTPSPSPSSTVTSTATRTNTATSTFTLVPAATSTLTPVFTPTSTSTPSPSPSSTRTSTATKTSTVTVTASFTATATLIPTATLTATAVFTATVAPTSSATAVFTPTPSVTATGQGTAVTVATVTKTPTVATSTRTKTATITPTRTRTSLPTRTSTNTRIQTATTTRTSTRTNTRTITGSPTKTRTRVPTRTSTFTPTRTLTRTPTITRTRVPSRTFTPTWTRIPTSTRTSTRASTSTRTRTPTRTATPSRTPSPSA